MLEVGKSYRTVDGRNTGPLRKEGKYFTGDVIKARDFQGNIMEDGKQFWHGTGNVMNPRDGEENDRIVGEWHDVVVGKTYYGSTGEVKVEAVANNWVFYSFGDSDNVGTLRPEEFLATYQPKRPTKTVWVNLWWNSTAGSIHMGQMHASEAEANRGGDRNGLLATISLEIPA